MAAENPNLLLELEEPKQLMGISAEVTDRKHAEEALHRQQQFLEAVLDTIQTGIVACDANGILTVFNRATREFHGLPQEPLPAEQWAEHYDLYFPDGKTRMRTEDVPLFRALRGERLHNVEMVIAPRHGPARTLLASGQPMYDSAGQKTGAVVAIHDISERKRAEEAARVLAGKLSTAQEAERSCIAREMHDDLTQRIAVLAIEAGKLEQSRDASESLSDKLREMKDQLIRLSEDVHTLSRQLHPSILDDLGLVDALRSECGSFSQRERIPIQYSPQNVPAGIPKEVALCLYRIAQEALRNIAKHSRAREASVSLTATDDSILLSVEDIGVGFSSGQTRGRHGLGLDSMEERARLIGGEFTIRSEPGKGTLVEVWAPYSGETP